MAELPQELVDRIARKENMEDREMIMSPLRKLGQRIKDNVMGTEEQNAAAKARMAKEDEESPDTVQAKVNRMINKKKGGKVSCYKSGGSVSSASKRGDGCAIKGKTKGRFV